MGATSAMLFTGISTGSSFFAQQTQAKAVTNQAAFDSQMADLNAKDAIARGDLSAQQRESAGRRTIGAQRAALAASGVDPNAADSSAVDLQGQEANVSEFDAQTIRNNAAREAWGFTTQAKLNQIGAEQQAAGIRAASYNTILTGAANTYGIYAESGKNWGFGRKGKPPKGPTRLYSGGNTGSGSLG